MSRAVSLLRLLGLKSRSRKTAAGQPLLPLDPREQAQLDQLRRDRQRKAHAAGAER